MPRSRSRSPRRERKRSRSRERSNSKSRDRDRDRQSHRRRRSRSRDKGRRRSRERRPERDDRRHGGRDRGHRGGGGGGGRRQEEEEEEEELVFQNIVKPEVTDEDIQSMPQSEQELMKVMGFSGFDTTKDKQVVGNDHYCANISKKRRYRQYMNRKGGFNRPLDFIA